MTARRLLVSAFALTIAAAVLIGLAAVTPWHTDSDAYFAGLGAVRDRLYADPRPDFDRASDAFFALQHQYRTPKWLYADLGYSALAWAALLTLVAAFRRGEAKGLTTRRLGPVFGATALALVLLALGLLGGPAQQSGREQVPMWSDSYGIVIFSTLGLMTFLAPVVAVLTLSPVVLTRRRPRSLIGLGAGWLWGVLTAVVYLAPLGVSALLVASVADPGGWALSTAGALLLWLFLNARAVWLGTPSSKALP